MLLYIIWLLCMFFKSIIYSLRPFIFWDIAVNLFCSKMWEVFCSIFIPLKDCWTKFYLSCSIFSSFSLSCRDLPHGIHFEAKIHFLNVDLRPAELSVHVEGLTATVGLVESCNTNTRLAEWYELYYCTYDPNSKRCTDKSK